MDILYNWSYNWTENLKNMVENGDEMAVDLVSSIFVQKENNQKKYFGIVHKAEHTEKFFANSLHEALEKQEQILIQNLDMKEINDGKEKTV